MALSNEISNQGGQKGLVTRNAEELDKIALLNVELTAMRGNLINIAADLFMNQKRVKQLNDRVGSWGKQGNLVQENPESFHTELTYY